MTQLLSRWPSPGFIYRLQVPAWRLRRTLANVPEPDISSHQDIKKKQTNRSTAAPKPRPMKIQEGTTNEPRYKRFYRIANNRGVLISNIDFILFFSAVIDRLSSLSQNK